jgi:hypothetical protein
MQNGTPDYLTRAIDDYNAHRATCAQCSIYHFDSTNPRCYEGIKLIEGIENEARNIGNRNA